MTVSAVTYTFVMGLVQPQHLFQTLFKLNQTLLIALFGISGGKMILNTLKLDVEP